MEPKGSIRDSIDNIDNQSHEPIEKKKRKYELTEKRKAAFQKMQEARRLQLENRKKKKEEISNPVSSSSSSSGTESENYESDKEVKPIIVSNYDDNEPDSKLKITKVKRRVTVHRNSDIDRELDAQLVNIYNEVKSEDLQAKQEEKSLAPSKKQSNRRKNQLDRYYERNKDVFTQHDGELEEIELTQDEWDALHSRFIEYEKSLLLTKLKKVSPKTRKRKNN